MKIGMKKPSKSKDPSHEIVCGSFSKRDAAATIAKGIHHVHSSKLGDRDPVAKQTSDAVNLGKLPAYGWESQANPGELTLASSVDRQAVIHQLVSRAGIEGKRFLREKVESTLEEMVSNALYHAYRDASGREKYARRSVATLGSHEVLKLTFNLGETGICLSVKDQAGTLQFQDVASSLTRGYQTGGAQIQSKEGGAGLGTYMIFDAVTHLKVVVVPGGSTTVSCWISDQRSYDPENFSFNFFRRQS